MLPKPVTLAAGGTPVLPVDVDPTDIDQRVLLHGMRFTDYEILLAMRGESAGPRLYYLDGTIEIMSPARPHEGIKTTIARLVEAWADETGLEFNGYGSWTLKNPMVERGAEPDECYIVGEGDKDVPDLAIEVEWTRGGLNKLSIYAGLGVGEVWLWRRSGVIEVYVLDGDHYVQVKRSRVMPELDLELIARCVAMPSQSQAVRALREAMRRSGRRPRSR